MSRRFVNLIVERCIGQHPASTLHRINPWRCFYPTTQQALAAADAANNRSIIEDARLPRAAMSFYKPCPPDDLGDIHFASIGRSINDIISMDQDGNTLLYDAAARAVRVMPTPHAPKHSPLSLNVGDGLYLLNKNPGPLEDHPFEALIHHRPQEYCFHDCNDEKWYWHSLPPPPYVCDDYGCGKVYDDEEWRRLCYERNGKNPYVISAYTVVGDSQIWISTDGGGTFVFNTTSGLWSKAGDWALPFYGRVEYSPDHGLWFGFTSEHRQFAACDLGTSFRMRPPVLQKVWDELVPPLPPLWVPLLAFLLPLGSGKFCVARMFDLAPVGWCREKNGNDYQNVESFVVFTGVEIERGSQGALRMIRHKSRRYSLGRKTAELM